MGVFTFVCRHSDGEWSGKQIADGALEASASSTFDLQRKLVQTVLATDSSGGIQSSFSLVTPSSAVFQVIVGGGGGAAFFGGGGGAAAAASGGAAPAAEVPEAEEKKKEEPAEESDDDMGFSLFD